MADVEGSQVLTATDSLLDADQRRLSELQCGVLVDVWFLRRKSVLCHLKGCFLEVSSVLRTL